MSGLKITNLCHAIDENRRTIHVSTTVPFGHTLAIMGSSGAGKSTLLKMIAKLLPAESGEIYLNNVSWNEFSPQEWRTMVHYVPQNPVMFHGTVKYNLSIPFTTKTMLKKASLSEAHMAKLLDALGLKQEILNQEANTLSGGEAARIGLIRSLLIDPPVLLLDEPTAHLDEESGSKVLNLLHDWISSGDCILIIVSHHSDELQFFNKLDVLHMGNDKEA